MADLTPDEMREMLRKLDDVIEQAHELSTKLKRKMAEQRRSDAAAADDAKEHRRKASGVRLKG